MKPAMQTAVITVLIAEAFFLESISEYETGRQNSDHHPINCAGDCPDCAGNLRMGVFQRVFGAYNFILGLLGIVPGEALVLVKESRAVGQGILIACGIMLVAGYGLYSNLP